MQLPCKFVMGGGGGGFKTYMMSLACPTHSLAILVYQPSVIAEWFCFQMNENH